MKEILEELADRLSDYEVWTDYNSNTPVGSNDLDRMKEEIITTIGEVLREVIGMEDR